VTLVDHDRVVKDLLALFLVAGVVVEPGAVVVAPVLPGLAEGKPEVDNM
jgi:hypothetical protein